MEKQDADVALRRTRCIINVVVVERTVSSFGRGSSNELSSKFLRAIRERILHVCRRRKAC